MFVAPLPSWQHRDSLVGDAVVKNFAQHIRLLAAPFMLARCRIRQWLLVDFEKYLFERIFRRAGGHQLVHGPGSKYSWPFSLQLSCCLSSAQKEIHNILFLK